MGVNASLSTTPSVSGTTASPSSVAASTSVGVQPQITRMAIEGIRGADGDMSWAGEWSSSSNYVANQVVYYEGSAYICIQGNSNLRPDQNTTQWSLVVSKGDAGATGAAGSAGATGAAGNTGPAGPQGASGPQGATGPQGSDGEKGATGDTGTGATVTIGSVTTGSAGSSASVSNSGSTSSAVLNFTIPTGADGANGQAGANGAAGANGQAATVSVGTVTTGSPGSSASVTNSGSSSSATLDFTIPRGNTGADGDIAWKGGWNSSTAYGVNEMVYYNGSSYVAIATNTNVTPVSDTSKWNLVAQAGAEGGAISSMSDTQVSGLQDNSLLVYQNSTGKWKNRTPFGTTYGDISIYGGTF